MSGTQRQIPAPTGNDDAVPGEESAAADVALQPRPKVEWIKSGSGFSAIIDGRTYRVTRYPADAPMQSPYGAYAEGRFIGGGPTLDNVKGRCNAHAGRLRLRSSRRPSSESGDNPAK